VTSVLQLKYARKQSWLSSSTAATRNVQFVKTSSAATEGNVPDPLLLGAHAHQDTPGPFVKETNVKKSPVKMVARVLA